MYGIGPERLSSCSCAQCRYGHTRGIIGFTAGHIYRLAWIIVMGQEWCMVSVLTGLVLRLGTSGRDGHTRGAIGFTAGHIYRLGHGLVV